MEAAKKILLYAAELIITIGLIYMGFSVYRNTQRISDNISTTTGANIQKMEEEHIVKYADTFISGAMVPSYVKAIYQDVLEIKITPLDKSTYDAKTISEDTLYRDMKIISNSRYVDPFASFFVTVERNVNGMIVAVNIVEQ